MILPIRLYGDPVLRQKARPVKDFKGIPALAQDLLETMYEAHGVGLAAPQVGLPIRMFVAAEFEEEHEEGEEPTSRVKTEFVVVNPTLEFVDRTPVLGLEGCLSIPGIYEEGVPRARALRVTYQNEHGQTHGLELEEYMARVFQHEFDHLEGKLFLDYLSREITEKYRTELTDMQRQAKAFLKEEKEREKTAQERSKKGKH